MWNWAVLTSKRAVSEECKYTLQALDYKWRTLPMFDPYIGVYRHRPITICYRPQAIMPLQVTPLL